MSRSRPDPSAQRAALAAKRAELRAQLAARRSVDPRQAAAAAKERRRRRRRLIAALIIVILLLLLRMCRGGEPEVVVEPPEVIEVEPEVLVEPPAPPTPPSRRKNSGKLTRTDRPDFEPPKPSTLPWLVAFRMQVAARSRSLAGCLQGTPEPGRLKWTTTVDPSDGTVSDHTLVPLLEGLEPSAPETACIEAVLSSPVYRLDPATAPDTPQRVSLVLEF